MQEEEELVKEVVWEEMGVEVLEGVGEGRGGRRMGKATGRLLHSKFLIIFLENVLLP